MKMTLKISGKVQGVWFRASTKKVADELGVVGFARNESDGSVTVVASGSRDKLDELREFCEVGPELATVKKVDVEWSEVDEIFEDFAVL